MTKQSWELVDITEKDIKAAQEFPSNFGLSRDTPHYEDIVYNKTWSLGNVILHRDSDILQESNAQGLKDYLETFEDIEDDWQVLSCNHWACGWVEHLSFKIFEDKDGTIPSKAFKVIKSFYDFLKQYPIWDEYYYFEREHEATINNIKDCAKGLGKVELIDNLPENWVADCYEWFSENDEDAIENRDGNGGFPSNESMTECLLALGFAKELEE
jgi:hypothetical protein